MIESRIASLTWSQSLSGWPSVTDSDVNRYSGASTMLVKNTSAAGSPGCYHRPRATSPDAIEPSRPGLCSRPMDAAVSLDPRTLDAADSLSGFRDRFVPTEPGVIYLDGN